MSQARNRRRLEARAQPSVGLDRIGQVMQKVQLIAEGLNLAQMGFMSVMRDVRQFRALVHEVARRVGMTDEEIKQVEAAAVAEAKPATEEARAQ